MNPHLVSRIGVGLHRKLASAYTGEKLVEGPLLYKFVFAGIQKLTRLSLGLMGKIRQPNLRQHSKSLTPLKLVKRMAPDKKCESVKVLKDKLIKKKKPKLKKVVKKKKAGWTSEARVSCEWCRHSFSR